ncbi:putative coiled-coil-helix-coiled-coil-helix domain-containing protein CHCHD2P9, mitochondrial [Saimiri boliviensis]|uniref:putative coiled-coil-helix-coiled-coil-helix domain-containing protein CHCHD2P9, mitochondrial n=1 Tax=Saimiri boliviensis TaxID=27679 RepID=UPI00193D9B62|nr:putative coiled-coil-helix-coiled-coil-helix domain-containing protein CHCHD2P9, mitochondrial [Saimiri boliviensis boliviensis]
MPHGSRSCTSHVATRANQVPHMRTTRRSAPAAQPPPAASPSAFGSPAAVPRQSSLMAQTATIAAESMGHTLDRAIAGGFSGGSNAEPARPDITYQEPQGTQMPQQQQPCFYGIKPLLECAQNQGDKSSVKVSVRC